MTPAVVHWSDDDWQTVHDTETHSGVAIHVADLPCSPTASGTEVKFTFYWRQADFAVIMK